MVRSYGSDTAFHAIPFLTLWMCVLPSSRLVKHIRCLLYFLIGYWITVIKQAAFSQCRMLIWSILIILYLMILWKNKIALLNTRNGQHGPLLQGRLTCQTSCSREHIQERCWVAITEFNAGPGDELIPYSYRGVWLGMESSHNLDLLSMSLYLGRLTVLFLGSVQSSRYIHVTRWIRYRCNYLGYTVDFL